MKNKVSVYVSPFGTHHVPDHLLRKMKYKKNGTVDKRCKAVKRIEKWAAKNMQEWFEESKQTLI